LSKQHDRTDDLGRCFVETPEMITRHDLDMSCSDRPAIENGHEPVFVDDISVDPARRDPAKHTFVAHVASLKPLVVPMLSEHKAFLVAPSTAAT